MHEQVARKVALVQAIEQADPQRQVLSDDDRRYASRSAKELAQWEASGTKSALTPELFLHQRAEQILKRIAERHPAFAHFAARRDWLRAIGLALPAVAFLAGAFVDRISDPHRVDLLSAPLLSIVLWNLLVVLVLLLSFVVPALRARRAEPGWPASQLARWKLHVPRKMPGPLVPGLTRFAVSWAELSRPLTAVRVRRIMHLSAACLALGVIASLYLRGMVSEYRAGWESTFLSDAQVHALLTLLFLPVTTLFQMPGFSIAEVRALQFSQPASPAGGALWVHLHAGTLFLLVVLPRGILGCMAWWKENRLAKNFPLDLGQPYFRQLTAQLATAAPAVLRVLPYSFAIDETRDRNLATVAKILLGEKARVMLRPAISYGEEPESALQGSTLDDPDITLTAVLFNLSATPEKENHGVLLDFLLRKPARGIAVLIDESAYLERVGTQAGGEARVRERIDLWRQFCELHHVAAMIVNLHNPQARLADLERGLAALVPAR